MTSCNGRNREVRQQVSKEGKIMGKSMQKTRLNDWKNQWDTSYSLCIKTYRKEPQRPVTAKRVQPKKLVVTVINTMYKTT